MKRSKGDKAAKGKKKVDSKREIGRPLLASHLRKERYSVSLNEKQAEFFKSKGKGSLSVGIERAYKRWSAKKSAKPSTGAE